MGERFSCERFFVPLFVPPESSVFKRGVIAVDLADIAHVLPCA